MPDPSHEPILGGVIALFGQLKKRMKSQKAIVAIARRLLKVIYKVIKTKEPYQEKGIIHFLHLQQLRLAYQKAIV